jgi:hypothetical protein
MNIDQLIQTYRHTLAQVPHGINFPVAVSADDLQGLLNHISVLRFGEGNMRHDNAALTKERADLRAERVKLQGENEQLRADLQKAQKQLSDRPVEAPEKFCATDAHLAELDGHFKRIGQRGWHPGNYTPFNEAVHAVMKELDFRRQSAAIREKRRHDRAVQSPGLTMFWYGKPMGVHSFTTSIQGGRVSVEVKAFEPEPLLEDEPEAKANEPAKMPNVKDGPFGGIGKAEALARMYGRSPRETTWMYGEPVTFKKADDKKAKPSLLDRLRVPSVLVEIEPGFDHGIKVPTQADTDAAMSASLFRNPANLAFAEIYGRREELSQLKLAIETCAPVDYVPVTLSKRENMALVSTVLAIADYISTKDAK